MAVSMKGRSFVSVADFSREEIWAVWELAAQLKMKQKTGEPHRLLEGKQLAMIFQKPSLRTQVSFETGMSQLGGHAVFLGPEHIQLGKRESVPDVARVLGRTVAGIMARVFAHEDGELLAAYAGVPGEQQADRAGGQRPAYHALPARASRPRNHRRCHGQPKLRGL